MWYSFLYLKIVKVHLHGVIFSSILVCKIPKSVRCKLWDQNFVSFDSGNIHIKESKKPSLIFPIELRMKFFWLISWSTFACSRMFCIGVKLGFWNFKPLLSECSFHWLRHFFSTFGYLFELKIHLKLSHEFSRYISFNIWR